MGALQTASTVNYDLPPDVKNFIIKAPAVRILTEQVQEVQADMYAAIKEECEKRIDELKNNVEEQIKVNAQMKDEILKQTELIKKAKMEAAMREKRLIEEQRVRDSQHEQQMKDMSDKFDRQTKDMQQDLDKKTNEVLRAKHEMEEKMQEQHKTHAAQ